MASFAVPLAMRAAMYFDVRMPDGATMTRQSRFVVREMIYAGLVPVTARIRAQAVGESSWQPVHGYPEFDVIFRLLGIEPPISQGTRKLAGWKAAPEVEAAPAPAPAPTGHAPRVDRATVRRAQVWLLGLPTALGALLVAGVFFAFFLVAIAIYVFAG
jgi:hypothetical protein